MGLEERRAKLKEEYLIYINMFQTNYKEDFFINKIARLEEDLASLRTSLSDLMNFVNSLK